MPKFHRNGVELHYELDGAGTPAVYICGFGAHSNDVLSQGLRAAFAPHHRLLVVDNRGAGQTVVPEGAAATLDDMADDIAALLDHLQMSPAHVLGISMGGAIAKTLALRHPGQVRSLVSAVSLAISEYPSRGEFMLETKREMQSQDIPRDLLNRFNVLLVLGESVFTNQELIEMWVAAPADPLEMSQAGYELQRAAMQQYNIRDQLGRITAPTLVISSPEDVLVPPRYQDEIAEGIPGASIKRYPGGHVFMMLPIYAASFAQDVLGFWAQHQG